jgi:signal peptide peptidase SppA
MSNPLFAGFAGVPALVHPEMSERFELCLREAVAHPDFARTVTAGDDGDFWPASDDAWGQRVRPYVVKDGILQIPVKGVLLHNFPYALGSWATGYDYIWRAFQRGCGDYATGVVKGIALIEDTPGGMVAGCFDAVDKMVALKASVGVPVRAFAHEAAYSAGYAIATVADKIVVSRTGGVGSIGVVTSHIDISGALQQAGIKVTFIASDPSKVEGNPTEPLSDDAKERIQARIDELYGIFVAAVSRSRGLSPDAIRGDLKAYCYTATQATSNGLADLIGSLDDEVAAFSANPCDTPDDQGDDEMATEQKGVDQATHDKAVADARTEGHAAGLKEGGEAATTRIGAILGSEEAKERGALANHFAFKTGMSSDDAKAALAVAPKEQKPGGEQSQGGGFNDAMGKDNPNVGAGHEQQQQNGGKPDSASADDVLAIIGAAGTPGFTIPKK